jgi:hypothetical protein
VKLKAQGRTIDSERLFIFILSFDEGIQSLTDDEKEGIGRDELAVILINLRKSASS